MKKRVKRMKKTVDHYNVILALPAVYPFPPKKMETHAEQKKRVATEDIIGSGPSSKYPLHNRSKKSLEMYLCVPGVCMKNGSQKFLFIPFLKNKILSILNL